MYRRRYESRRSSKPKLHWKQKKIIKYGENDFEYGGWNSYTLHDHDTDFARWLHSAMWHVALESWQWIHQVAAPCSVIRDSGMTCHWIRLKSDILEFCNWFRFRPHHRSRRVILHQSPNRNFIQIGSPSAEKMTSCWFSRWPISAIFDFRDPIMGSLKSPITYGNFL